MPVVGCAAGCPGFAVRLSLAAILIGGLSGLSLAIDAHGGAVTGTGFALLSLLWLWTTANGLRSPLRRDFDRHRRFAQTHNAAPA